MRDVGMIPEQYRRDICSHCGKVISFGKHKFLGTAMIGPEVFANLIDPAYFLFNIFVRGTLCQYTADVIYTGGLGFAQHRDCGDSGPREFDRNVEQSIQEIGKRIIKPNNYFLRLAKHKFYSLAYLLLRGYYEGKSYCTTPRW